MSSHDTRPLWEALDLSRHAVIEASAGTGKTYTIENLVVRLLSSDSPEDVRLDQILVVTFTEKATGELRDRIRQTVEDTLTASPDPATRDRLAAAHADFDSAQVFTIHGFCHRFLQQFAFENDHPLEGDITSDESFYGRLFRQQLRTVWATDVLPRLTAEERGRAHRKGFFEEDVVALARSKRSMDQLLPEPLAPDTRLRLLDAVLAKLAPLMGESFVEDYLKLDLRKAVCREQAPPEFRLQAEVGKRLQPREGPATTPRPADTSRLDLSTTENDAEASPRPPPEGGTQAPPQQHAISGLTPKSVKPIWEPLHEIVSDYRAGKPVTEDVGDALARWYAGISYKRFWNGDKDGTVRFGVLVPPRCRPGAEPTEDVAACPSLPDVIDILERDLDPLLWASDGVAAAIAGSVERLIADVDAYKRENGVVTFDDLLQRVDDALGDGNTPAADALRRKYRYVLVDEFQDTDPVQWSIFRKAFVAGDTGHRLFLIGDPKQAIYGFRGADVWTYLRARDEIMQRCGPGSVVSLSQNWRSVPELIEAFNRLFACDAWFGVDAAGSATAIAHNHAATPAHGVRKARLYDDRTRRSALTAVHVDTGDGKLTGGVPLRRMARFTATEIARLMLPAPLLDMEAPDDGVRRLLRCSDICVLVRNRREARVIEQALSAHDPPIPYSHYKKPGVYQSAEAAHIAYLLRAVAFPADEGARRAALLTRFFRHSMADLAIESMLDDSVVRDLFEKWSTLCEIRNWAGLFRSFVEDTGILFREAACPGGERRVTNYEHILQDLAAEALTRSLDVVGIYELLELRRHKSVALGEDADLHRLETEEPRVQIMTMHAAKGLQFPVVFVAGGFSSGASRDQYVVYHDERGRRVFEIKTDHGVSAAARSKEEALEEDKRLLYVALTRARYKLYVPWCEYRSEAPVTSFLFASLATAWPDVRSDPVAGHVDWEGTELAAPAWQPRRDEEPRREETAVAAPPEPAEADAGHLLPPEIGDLTRWQRRVSSFSRLAHHRDDRARVETDYADRPDVDVEGTPSVADTATGAGRSVPTLLPPGTKTGTALHEVFEAIDFAQVGRTDDPNGLLAQSVPSRKIILDAMARNRLQERRLPAAGPGEARSTSEEVARLVWHALRTPLDGDRMRLADIRPEDRKVEQEFYVPAPDGGDGLLHGFIDLVFRHEGRYHILDWKTNWLEDGYSTDAVLRCMEQEDYLLQVRLYTLAVVAWLRQSVPGFRMETHFGGVYYLFLRGMTGLGLGQGIYFDCPDARGLERYQAYVRARLHPGSGEEWGMPSAECRMPNWGDGNGGEG